MSHPARDPWESAAVILMIAALAESLLSGCAPTEFMQVTP